MLYSQGIFEQLPLLNHCDLDGFAHAERKNEDGTHKARYDFFCLDLLSSSQNFLQACSPLSEHDC